MKKIITIALAVCLVLSVMVVGVYAEETATQSRPQFSREGMPQRGQFDPNNMPQRGQFNPENMPQGESPQFGGEGSQGGQTGATERPSRQKNASDQEGNPAAGEVPAEGQPPFEGGMGGGRQFGGMQRPGGNMPGAQQQADQQQQPMTFMGFVKTYTTPIIAVVMLGLAFLFVIFYRRKNY